MPDGFIKKEEKEPKQLNVLGSKLVECSTNPLTGYFRNGCCDSDEFDYGMHTVCALMTNEFLEFSKSKGNDLSTPRPEYSFSGLKEGDFWCLCASRWLEAYKAGKAPKVKLSSTNILTLNICNKEYLYEFAIDNPKIIK